MSVDFAVRKMFALLTSLAFAIPLASSLSCKKLPGDPDWPSDRTWSSLNRTVEGNLIKTIPFAAPCFNPTFDEDACINIQDNWERPELFLDSPSSIMNTAFLNKSCDPFLGPDGECIVGVHPEYAINVQSPRHVVAGIKFAKRHNIRLIIKNTGHDYMGRSTGKGALSLWTHSLQSTEWMEDYRAPGSSYRGPAVKVGAGAMSKQVDTEAHEHGHHAITGFCPTVGFAGGYISGGGTSLLSSKYGMAADHVLSMEVITPSGKFITISPRKHSDLFWAMRGGGGGTYGIVWSVTVRVFPDVPMGLVTASFTAQDNNDDVYWAAIKEYARNGVDFPEHEITSLAGYTTESFGIAALTYPNCTREELVSATAPLFEAWDNLGLVYSNTLDVHPSYFEMKEATPAAQQQGANLGQGGGRLLPQSAFESEEAIQRYVDIGKEIALTGVEVQDAIIHPGYSGPGDHDSAVYPQWRTTARLVLLTKPYSHTDSTEKILADRDFLTNNSEVLLKSLSPGIGAYLNEADPFNPEWKADFYGENYDRLLSIKDRYDPDQLLYGRISVGSDRWTETEEERLCPV